MRNLIFYKTTADFDNTGEVLIYKSLLQFLRQYGDVIINDGAAIQPLFLQRLGIRESERLSHYGRHTFMNTMLSEALKSLFTVRKVYFVTGVGEHSVDGRKNIIKNYAAFVFTILLRMCGVKLVRIGMSMRFGDKIAELSERILAHAFNFYYVRDSISLRNCQKAGIKKCQLAPDLSWGYQILRENEQTDYSSIIVFSFRHFCEAGMDNRAYHRLLTTRLVSLITHLQSLGHYELWLTHQCNEDYAYMEEVYKTLPNKNHVTLKDELVTLDNGVDYYGRALLTFSNRLHVMLLGYKFGSPTICLTDVKKHRKIAGIFQDNGLDSVLVDITHSEKELLAEVDRLISNRITLENKIRQAERKNHETLCTVFRQIFHH